MTTSNMSRRNRGGLGGRPTRANLFLALVALLPVLLIAYSLGASLLLAREGAGARLVVSALLITAVGGFVIWDTLLSPARAVRVPVRARSRRAAVLR
jgi:hypothetical protein